MGRRRAASRIEAEKTMGDNSATVESSRVEAVEGRCGAGPCGYHYDTGGSCSGRCTQLVDASGHHLEGGGHVCENGHPF